ncbi:hypothetical protein HZS_3008 [Henneguya salminicola]|nr:hypothetical protein HZS_3008 [Henneguya salminicola]
MEEIELKYSALSFEYSKLRTRFQCLRQYYINLKNKYSENNEKVNNLQRTVRQLELETDGMKFRNEQLVQRILFLQNELKSEKISTQPMKNKDQQSQERNSLSEGLDFFIETTEIKTSHTNSTISQENILNQNELPSFGRSLLCNLPRRSINMLEHSIHNCLTKLYDVIKTICNLICDFIKKYSLDFTLALNIVESGLRQVLMWKDLPQTSKNRIRDVSTLVKPLIMALSILISQIQFISKCNLNISSRCVINFLMIIKNCISETECVFAYLSTIPASLGSTRMSSIENVLIFLRNQICKYSVTMKNFIVTESPQDCEFLSFFTPIIADHKAKVSDALIILNIIIDNELPALRLYGWWPMVFVSSSTHIDSSEQNKQASYFNYQNFHANCNRDVNTFDETSYEVQQLEASQDLNDTKRQLDEATLQITNLNKEKHQLSFELQAISLSSHLKTLNDSTHEDYFYELRKYFNEEIDKFYQENQLCVGQISALSGDLRSAMIRLKTTESEKRQLEFTVKKLSTNLENENQDNMVRRTNYENTLRDLTDEINLLRKTNPRFI